MRPYFRLLPSLLAPVLLVSLSACSKKDVVEVQNLASYSLDGHFRTCSLTQTTTTQAEFDYLTLRLTTTPQPSSGPEVLDIKLWKLTGQPTSTYSFLYNGSADGVTYTATPLPPVGYYLTSATRTFTSTTGFSGSFTSEARTATGPDTRVLTGTLTNVQL
ncbi:hypothetical protein [Hymenobacter bucti]|uniref:Lipoprotein n=1 Tax=Hymenobacter bucti TaxID=1844114 RepID=A0ABW4QY75_9BACT